MDGGLHNEPPQSLYEFSEKLYNDKITLVVLAFTQRPTRKKSPAPNSISDDGHGFYYIDTRDMVIVRDPPSFFHKTRHLMQTPWLIQHPILYHHLDLPYIADPL